MTASDAWGAVGLVGAIFLLFGLAAYVADRRARAQLRSELREARTWLREVVYAAAAAPGHPLLQNSLASAYAAVLQLREELRQL